MNSWSWSKENINRWKDKLPVPSVQTRKVEVGLYLWTDTMLKHKAPSPPYRVAPPILDRAKQDTAEPIMGRELNGDLRGQGRVNKMYIQILFGFLKVT